LLQEGDFDAPVTIEATLPSYYSSSTEQTTEEKLYDILLAGLKARDAEIKFTSLNLPYTDSGKQTLENVFSRVINDNPELFYVAKKYGIKYNSKNYIVEVDPTYCRTEEETTPKSAEMKSAEQAALTNISSGMSDLEKALVLHDYLVEHITYDWDVATGGTEKDSDVFNAYGALVEGNAVCQGYAQAYKLLLDDVGISSTVVTSTAMTHAWNLVKIGENWYHVDVTWDDAAPDTKGQVLHTYFMLSDETMLTRGTPKHHDWTQYYTCNDVTYETGYIFSGDGYDGTYSKIYNYENKYYYIFDGDLYSSETLIGTGTLVKDFYVKGATGNEAIYTGFYWLDGYLYYCEGLWSTNPYVQIKSYNLEDGTVDTLGEKTPYTRQATEDYAAEYDNVGLTYDASSGTLTAWSSVTRTAITTGIIPPTELDGADAKIKKVVATSTSITADLVRDANVVTSDKAVTLTVALYNNGKLVGVYTSPVTWKNAYSEVTLNNIGTLPSHTTTKAFLTYTSTWTPICTSYDSSAA
jgi:hypothetical protein